MTLEHGNYHRINQLKAQGYDLVRMTSHYPTCNECAKYQGRVYSISGLDAGFPPLSTAFSGSEWHVHSGCRHIVVPYVEQLKTPAELAEDIAYSNRPFIDNRTEEERALYEKQQDDALTMAQDRRDFELLQKHFLSIAPKSFSAYRRMKNSNSQNYLKLKEVLDSFNEKPVVRE